MPLRHGIPAVLSTYDRAMFHASFLSKYRAAAEMSLNEAEIVSLRHAAAEYSFLPDEARRALLATLPRT